MGPDGNPQETHRRTGLFQRTRRGLPRLWSPAVGMRLQSGDDGTVFFVEDAETAADEAANGADHEDE